MDKKRIASTLEILEPGKNRSTFAQYRDIFEDVEKALQRGVEHEDVLKVLNDNGLRMKINTFRSYTNRLRRLHRNKNAPGQE